MLASLERIPNMLKQTDLEVNLVFYGNDMVDVAVKNSLIKGPDQFMIDQSHHDMDSYQLRKFFEDQDIIIEFLSSQFKVDITVIKPDKDIS